MKVCCTTSWDIHFPVIFDRLFFYSFLDENCHLEHNRPPGYILSEQLRYNETEHPKPLLGIAAIKKKKKKKQLRAYLQMLKTQRKWILCFLWPIITFVNYISTTPAKNLFWALWTSIAVVKITALDVEPLVKISPSRRFYQLQLWTLPRSL